MTTTYTIPNRPSGTDTRSISAILADFDAVLGALNVFDGGNIQNNTIGSASLVDAAKLGLSAAGTTRRGKSIIAGTETRSSTVFGTLPTPDRVQNLSLPTDGLVVVWFSALWGIANGETGKARIMLGSNEVVSWDNFGTATTAYSRATSPTGVGGQNAGLMSGPGGLASSPHFSAAANVVTTGQAMSGINDYPSPMGGPCYIFATAGTYDVSIQFMTVGGGTCFVSTRKLWAMTMGF